jgi:uncharacterized membrane protein YbhN (UPF0104 family)
MTGATDGSLTSAPPRSPPPGWKRLLRWAVGCAVLLAVAWHVRKSWADLLAQSAGRSWSLPWLALSAAAYALGLLFFAAFFRRILCVQSQALPFLPLLRAYILSHLGKYIPGKALVVVIRAHESARAGARVAAAVLATFYETFLMMAAGASLATLAAAAVLPHALLTIPLPFASSSLLLPLWTLALLMALPLLAAVLPPCFNRLVRLLRSPFPDINPNALPRIHAPLFLEGLAWAAAGWLAWAASLLAVIAAMGEASPSPQLLALALACIALATVAGFLVAVFPGGLVIREGVLMATLGPALGNANAILAAVVLRLVWILTELLASALTALPLAQPPHNRSLLRQPPP